MGEQAADRGRIAKFRAAVTECGMEGAVISHDSYLINLSALAEEARTKSREALTRELNRCGALGIPFVVSHLGAHMGEGVDAGLQLVAQGVRQALDESPESVTLLAETTAGQGSSLDARFEEIARLFELTGDPARLGVCLDTCHIFAAGYDLRTEEDYAARSRSSIVWSGWRRSRSSTATIARSRLDRGKTAMPTWARARLGRPLSSAS